MDNNQKLSVIEKIGFGMGDAACGIVYSSVTMFLTYFYTDIYGLSAAAVGIMFLATRIFDAIIDPITGMVADRTKTRWGRFRPWLIWFAIPYAVLAVMTYTTPDFGYSGKLLYAYVTYALLMLCYTFINIPYCALGGVIARDEKDRLSAQSYRFTIASASGLMVSIGTLFLVDWLGKENKQLGFQLTMAVMGVIAIGMLVFCFATTEERVVPIEDKNVSVKKDLKCLLGNDQWCIVALITFFSSMAGVMRSSATLYYATYLMMGGVSSAAGTAMKSAFESTSVVGTILGAMAAGYFALKLGMAIAGALVGISLGLLGYQAGVNEQTPLATMGIIGLLTIGPAFSYLLLWWLMRFYKLDDKMMEKIQSDLLARQQNKDSHD